MKLTGSPVARRSVFGGISFPLDIRLSCGRLILKGISDEVGMGSSA